MCGGTSGVARAFPRLSRVRAKGVRTRARWLGILGDEHHRRQLELPDEDLRRLYIWLDANVPFYGSYRDGPRGRQLAGEAVEPPPLQ